jgi:CheY-like chemotaxis protein
MPNTALAEDEGPSIFIVDDDPAQIRLCEEALRESYAKVTIESATTGEAALEHLLEGENSRAGLPDIIILDLDLPKMSGAEVLHRIRTTDSLQMVPVVILSGNSEQPMIDGCYRLGANAYLLKPDSYTELLDLVQNVAEFWTLDQIRYPSQ